MSNNLAKTLQAALYQRFEDLDGVDIELHNELLAVRVNNASASALVYLQGAQLAHYQRHDEHPVIWCSPQCDYRKGTPLRGGVPVCWPWLGALEDNALPVRRQVPLDIASPNGFARHRMWQLAAVECPSASLTRIRLTLSLDAGQETAWPMASALEMTIAVGDRLQISLAVTNHSDYPYYFTGALHSHYAISDLGQVSIGGLERMNYVDRNRDGAHGRQRGALAIDGAIDRVYHGTWQPLTLVDRGWRRELLISSEGSDNAVVWNPGAEKAQNLSHFPADAWREMLCIETANAEEDFAVLKPGKTHHLGITVRCRPLS